MSSKNIRTGEISLTAKATTDIQAAPPSWQKYIQWIHLSVIAVVFFIVAFYCTSDKIELSGDNIYYYILGKALATGHGYVDISTPHMTPHNHFPPGYPFIISLFMRLGFEDITFFNKLNSVFALLAVIILYKTLIRLSINRHIAFITCLFTVLNANIISYATMCMSEVPYILFSFLTLYFFTKTDLNKKFYKDIFFFLVLLAAVSAFYIRSSGITLIAALIVCLLVRKKWLHAISFAGGFILCILPWQIRSSHYGGNSYMKLLLSKSPYAPELGKAGLNDFWNRVTANTLRYISAELPTAITGRIFDPNNKVETGAWILGLVILALCIFALVKFLRSLQLLPIALYVIFTGGLLLLWPEKWIGIRFVLPVIPLLLLLMASGIDMLVKGLLRKRKALWSPYVMCFPMLSMVTPLNILSEKAEEPYPLNFQNYFLVAEWAKKNTPANSIVCCRKPELFYLFSDRKCTGYPYTLNTDSMIYFLDSAKVNFVVLEQLGFSSTAKYMVPAINKNNKRFSITYMVKPPETYLLQFLPPSKKREINK